ncbi:MAG: polyphosphate kinase [Sphingomonadaceae bacterium]|jgi:AMP-polyphosphate phosphotransferase|nr:polyphosphate kinase [Sphingomonadaceae bacterium]NBU78016.1 polyphosphate kinase [Sphingomonadaceae bacterium]NCA02084.1 polyphosphate kinase [Sphingomonadaceae bacterium]
MSVDLSQFESGHHYVGDYAADLEQIQRRLARIQAAYILHGGRAMIAVEGWDAAGKGGAIRQLSACWDARWCDVWSIGTRMADEADRHFLWRFWQCVPARGHISVFDRTWYCRVLVERVEAKCSEAEWQRAYDEINEFEAQQRDMGTTLIKIFLHVTADEQDKRLKARLNDPWQRWKTGPDDYRNRARRPEYLKAYGDMFARCNTRWAPWTIVDGNHKRAARMAVLQAIADQLEHAIDMCPPPLDPDLAHVAELAFGPQWDA